MPAILAAALVAGAIGVMFWGRSPAAQSRPAEGFWGRVFHTRQKTNIVLSDAVYRQVQFYLGRDLSLSEYLSPGYPVALGAAASPDVRRTLEFLARQQTTSVGSATLASRLAAFGARMGGDAAIRYPRHVNAREFNTDSFILLGSRLSIPWEEMFEPRLNFPLATDAATHHFYLRNLKPQRGEAAEYRESADQTETYADIALLPNLSGTGTVLILNGIDMVAAEAAGEFAMNGGLSAGLGGAPGDFEALVRVRAVGGAVERTEVVALRKSK